MNGKDARKMKVEEKHYLKYGNNYIMSKIEKPIIISQGTEAKIEGNFLKLKGKMGNWR